MAQRRADVPGPESPDAPATSGSDSPSVYATCNLGISQAGHGNAAVVAEGDTSMVGIPGARGDAFRTGLPRLFKTRGPFWTPEATVNPAAFIGTKVVDWHVSDVGW